MIADNQIAIVGGRNLGDEYFSASATLQFRDLDVFAAGPIAANDLRELRRLLEQHARVSAAGAEQAEVRSRRTRQDPRRLAPALAHATPIRYNAKPLNATPLAHADRARTKWDSSGRRTEFEADSPAKIEHPSDDYKSPPMQRLGELIKEAQQRIPDPVAVLRAARCRRQGARRAHAARRARRGADQFARRHRRRRRAGGLRAVSRAAAEEQASSCTNSSRPRAKANDADRGPLRLAFAREPACEDVCDRSEYSRDRLDESRSALGAI